MTDPDDIQCEFCTRPEYITVWIDSICGEVSMCRVHYREYVMSEGGQDDLE